MRMRMPLAMAGAAALPVAAAVDRPAVWWAAVALFAVGTAFYTRAGTPHGPPVDIGPPVRGHWTAVNSPTSRVPSHGVHAWAQTYGLDLVHDPGDGAKPSVGWWPIARRPDDFPGFGKPVFAPVSGEVVRARDGMRDHRSRTSPPALVYFALESVRELLGPPGVLGNHVVIRRDDGACVLVAHLKRYSLRVARGDRVDRGTVVGRCGNSGNSTEPHVHVQAMTRPGVWLAEGRPLLLDGREPPPDGEALDVVRARRG